MADYADMLDFRRVHPWLAELLSLCLLALRCCRGQLRASRLNAELTIFCGGECARVLLEVARDHGGDAEGAWRSQQAIDTCCYCCCS